MITIEPKQVQVQAQARDKQDAIRQVAQLLVESGAIETGYIQSMLGRERVANTYLGNGIAIPHGMPEDRALIHQTGIAVLQVAGGVTWNAGETARLIVGIAAKSDEHIEVLRRLTRVLGNQDQVALLSQTRDPRDIIEALTGERPALPVESAQLTDYPSFFDAVIHNSTGLHARPASVFVDLAKEFQADIRVRHGSEVVSGKSLMSLLQLGVSTGANVRVSAQGADATTALRELQAAIADGLGDEPEQQAVTAAPERGWKLRHVDKTLSGVSAAGGIAIGVTHQHTMRVITVEDAPSDPLTESNRFQEALTISQRELEQLYEEVRIRLGSGKAAIFRVHAQMLEDADLIRQTSILMFQRHSASWSWQQVINERVSQMQKINDPVLAARAIDLSDVGQRVLRHLMGMPEEQSVTRETPIILLADDLTPSDTANINPDTVLGFCTVKGGPTSHTAILARSLGIPAIVGAGSDLLDILDGTPAIIDGAAGQLYLNPSEADIQAARTLQKQAQEQLDVARNTRFAPAITSDGHHIEVAANINRASEAQQALEAGAEGVGLMRTEFLYLEQTMIPSEEEQFVAYRDMVQALQGRPLIIRTLDIGGDKEVPYLHLAKEDNSFLGIRGIRFCLARQDLFIPQLRAIYRAAAYGPVSIMFPMIALLDEWHQACEIAERVRVELNAPVVPRGIMVEVPSAAVLANQFAQEVDFFSIGTNDLTQYTLAMDRLHPQLAKQADGLHPAVLALIAQTVQAARKENKWVGVCGGIAGDPQGATILTGLGVSELSVSIPSIAPIKAQLRERSLAEMQQLAQRALQCRTAAEVRAL